MAKAFYKDIKIIRYCKVCGVHYRLPRYDWRTRLGYCYKCRRVFFRDQYHNYWLPYLKSLPPERQKEIRKQKQERWMRWVVNNFIRRRQQALKSYHLRKAQAPKRLHRRKGYAPKWKRRKRVNGILMFVEKKPA